MRRAISFVCALLLTFAATQSIVAQGAGSYTGTITNQDYFATVQLPGVAAGQTITIDAQATSGNLDTLVILLTAEGEWVGENDDREQGNFNSFLSIAAPSSGDYLVVVTRYGEDTGSTTGDFSLVIDIGGAQAITVTSADVGVNMSTVIDTEAGGYPTLAPTETIADWTILAYLDADNNLEAGIMQDLDEFERGGGSTESVRIVALLDRAEDYDTSNGDWTDARLYEPGPDKSNDAALVYPPTLDSDPLAYMGEIDMGADMTLLNFLVWGMRTYPAERYAISLNNHGAAWRGTVWDDSTPQPHNNLGVLEMAAIFERALAEVGRERFDLLINDSCLMASVENFAAVAPYFDYAFSSPEIMNNPGFDMTTMTETLNANPDIAIPELGQIMADKYMQDMNLGFAQMATYMGVAVIDLSEFGSLVNSLTQFTDFVTLKPEAHLGLLGRARANAYTYSTWAGSYESIDVGDLMSRIVQGTADDDMRRHAQAVLDTLDDAIVYSTAGDLLSEETSFYNIFFPIGTFAYDPSYAQLTPLAGWGNFLQTYFSSINADDGEFGFDAGWRAPEVRVTNVFPVQTSIYAPPVISMEVVGNNISHGDFTVDRVLEDGTLLRLTQRRILTETMTDEGVIDYVNFWHPGVDDFEFTWGASVPFVTDGQTSNPERVVDAGEVTSLSGLYLYPNSDVPIDVDIIFDEYGEYSAMIARHRDSAGFANIRPETGGLFAAYRFLVTPDGESYAELGNEYVWPEGGLSWSNRPAPTGLYDLGFLVTGFTGDAGFGATTVQVDHDDVNENYRGYVDDEWGYNFVYPADWSGFSYYSEGGWEAANSPTQDQFIYVYPVEPSATDPLTVANETMAQYGVTIQNPTPITVDGRDAMEFTYEWVVQGGTTYSGRAFAVYQESIGLGLVIASEAINGAEFDSTYELLRDTTVFFDPADIAKLDTGKWYYDFSDNASFPVLEDWGSPFTFDEVWRMYTEDGNSETIVNIALTERPANSASDVIGDLLVEYFSDAQGMQMQPQRTYYSEANTWEYVTFTNTASDGSLVVSGIFVTVRDGIAHIIWWDAPESRIAQLIPTFYVTIDGYTINS
jgi:hypothetical protein